jgi:predicted nucleotidyltransferase
MPTASLPLFRSTAQARLLAHLYLAADRPESLSALSKRLGIPLSVVQREVDVLERAGIVSSERVGNTRLVAPNRESTFYDDLSSLLLKAFGPATVLTHELAGVPGVHAAYLYGSWARRERGETAEVPRDIDVAVIGVPDANDVYAAARRAESALDIEVNPMIISPQEWDAPRGVIRRIKAQPLVELEVGDAAA